MGQLSRREMIAGSAGLAGFMFIPARVLGRGGAIPPSEKFNVAIAGIGNRGSFHVREIANHGHNLVALCDVDWRRPEGGPGPGRNPRAWQMAEQFSKAKKYDDWRIMLQEQEKNIDGVIVATPDHDHAVISMAAMKMGKAVYTEKPIGHSVEEIRLMIATAAKYKVTTQCGCQGHASEPMRMMVEAIKDGAIGEVREMEIICSGSPSAPNYRPGPRPTPRLGFSYADIPKRLAEQNPVPDGLLWDLWLGPADSRPYNPAYMGWRRWRAFGDGSIGDMASHYFDLPFWALDIRHPVQVEAETDKDYDWETNKWTIPDSIQVRWSFPARGKLPPMTVTWHQGPESGTAKFPSYWKDEYWPKYVESGKPCGDCLLVVGSKGAFALGNPAVGMPTSFLTGEYRPVVWSPPEGVRLIPEELDRSYKRPPHTLPRVFSHWADWIESAKAGKKSGGDYSYSGPMGENGLLSNLAVTQKGKVLDYDGKTGTFPRNDEANKLLKLTYREGFKLPV